MKKTHLILLIGALLLCNTALFAKTIHVFVPLCDNENQGIVPVPDKIGNGQDPFNNLYWGCLYGYKTHLKRSAEWTLKKTFKNPKTNILESCLFQHTKDPSLWLLADAYDGAKMKACVMDFLNASAGIHSRKVTFDGKTLAFGGESSLLAFTGHNGLMDFTLYEEDSPKAANNKKRSTIILACISKSYFKEPLKKAGADPLLWTNGLMSPEAYTLKAAIEAWRLNKSKEEVHKAAANAYNKYQKCGYKGAYNLFSHTSN